MSNVRRCRHVDALRKKQRRIERGCGDGSSSNSIFWSHRKVNGSTHIIVTDEYDNNMRCVLSLSAAASQEMRERERETKKRTAEMRNISTARNLPG